MKNNNAKITPFPASPGKKKPTAHQQVITDISLCMIALVSLIGLSELLVVGSYSIGKTHMSILQGSPTLVY